MELRAYGKILWRRIWIIVLVVGVVALYVAYQYYVQHKAAAVKIYTSQVNVRIGLQSGLKSNLPQAYNDYVTISEALADELVTGPVLTSDEFGTQVFQQIKDDMPAIKQRYGANADLGDIQTPASIIAALTPKRAHSSIMFSVSWNSEAGAWAIAHAVGEVCAQNMPMYLDYKVNTLVPADANYPTAAAKVISDATQPIAAGPASNKTILLIALLLVGLIIGIALAFLVEYLDDRIHSSEEIIQALQLPIYGEVPPAPTAGQSKLTGSKAA